VRARAFDALGEGGLARSVGLGSPPAAGDTLRVVAATRGTFFEIEVPDSVPFREIGRAVPAGGAPHVSARGDGARVEVAVAAAAETFAFVLVDPWGRPRPIQFAAPRVVRLGRPERFSPSDLAEVTLPGDALREPAFVVVREEPSVKPLAAELRALAPPVVVDAGLVPLASDFDVVLRPAGDLPESAQVGIFVQEGGDFRYIGGAKDAARGGFSARTRTSFPIGLFEDRAAPSVGQPRLETRSGRVRLVFSARDGGAGIDCTGIEILMNGAPVPHEFDVERGDVVAFPDVPAREGAGGAVDVRVVDRCGNARRWTGTVRLH
jgi:hypothetical protein